MANQNSESNFIDPSQDENFYRDEQSEIKGSMNSFLSNNKIFLIKTKTSIFI